MRPMKLTPRGAVRPDSSIHRTEVSLLERAQREPRLGTIVRLARALDIPAAKLLDGIR